MRKCLYYVTISADGFIADSAGSTAWMSPAPHSDYGFNQFYYEVSTIVMGRATFDVIYGLSGAENFPYADKEVIVATHRALPDVHDANVSAITDIEAEVARLKLSGDPGLIWVAGGAHLASQLLAAGLLDEVRLFIQPIILGSGRSLFADLEKPAVLRTEEVRQWPGGIIEQRYLTVKSWRTDI